MTTKVAIILGAIFSRMCHIPLLLPFFEKKKKVWQGIEDLMDMEPMIPKREEV